MKTIQMYDTTLRDGMQGMEISYTLDDKLKIAHALDDLKIDYIEGGFPLSNEKEARFFAQCAKESFSHAKITAFGSTRRPGADAGTDKNILALLEAETPAVTVVGKTWTAHVREILKTGLEENLDMIRDSIALLKKEGREVLFDLEHFFDGYLDDPGYALRVLAAGTEAGADMLVLCDTNGGMLPSRVSRIIGELPLDSLAPVGVHFHNDCGTAAANSIVAVECGAVQVQGTINGWGERCGNANLCTVIPNLVLKMGYEASVSGKLASLTSLSRFVAEKANIIPDKRQPYVGEAAFSHKAGQHADVIAKASGLMEHIDSSLVGNARRILLSELAGKATIVEKLKQYGDFSKEDPVINELITILKTREKEGFEYEAAEASFELLLRKAIDRYTPLIELKNYHLETYKALEAESQTVGRIFLRTPENELMGAAVGIGPVETLDHALRNALEPHYGFLKHISLSDYRVRVLNPEEHTAAKVRVFITSDDGNTTWDTVGVHENVIEASWMALVDSIEYYYNTFVLG